MAQQLNNEMYFIDTIFTVFEVLEILIDIVTFTNLWEEDNWFDSGTIAGKGLVNAGFTIYYLIRDNFYLGPNNQTEEELAL